MFYRHPTTCLPANRYPLSLLFHLSPILLNHDKLEIEGKMVCCRYGDGIAAFTGRKQLLDRDG